MRITPLILAAVGASAATALAGDPPCAVVPNVNEDVFAPSNQNWPWNQGGMRYQQLYAADQLGGLTGVIDAFAYRVDEEFGGAFGPTTTVAQIWLGYSDADPGAISTVFDDNFSCCKTLVLDGEVVLSSSGSGFDVLVDVDDVFDYDGSANLLMEIIIPGGSSCEELDAAGLGLGQGGTPWTDRLWALDPGADVGNEGGDDGMVTKFIFAEGGCPADCNGDANLDILDFVCFQTEWQQQTDFGDCNADGAYDILDFVCYQGLFQDGCD